MTPPQLLARLRDAGFRLDVTAAGPELVRVRPGATLSADLLAGLKANREAVLRFVTCRECGRVTCDEEDRERLAGVNPFCDRGGCPYRRRT